MTEERDRDLPSANIQNSNEPTDNVNKESVDHDPVSNRDDTPVYSDSPVGFKKYLLRNDFS